MKAISLTSILLIAVSCAQVEPDLELLPTVVITAVTERAVEFEVRNESSREFFYLGWEEGRPLATSEVFQRDKWYQSWVTFCATGAEMFSLAPGASFKDSVPNMNQGPMRVNFIFQEHLDWDSGVRHRVKSELHEDWRSQ